MSDNDEPKPWRLMRDPEDRYNTPTMSRAADTRYSDDPEAYPKTYGRILQHGVNAEGHSWFWVSVSIWVVNRQQQVQPLNWKSEKVPTGGRWLEQVDYAIIEFANPTTARVRLLSSLRYDGSWQQDGSWQYFVYDWIVVSIARQPNKNVALGRVSYKAVKRWRKLPFASGSPVTQDVYYAAPSSLIDTGFYGVEP